MWCCDYSSDDLGLTDTKDERKIKKTSRFFVKGPTTMPNFGCKVQASL